MVGTMNDYYKEKRALEDAFVNKMLLDYDIREVTTQKQAKNGTREFEFPVSTFDGKYNWYKKWQVKTNRKRLPNIKLRLAIFKSGYVRRQNGCYCPYPINRRYKRLHKYTVMRSDGKKSWMESRQYMQMAYEKHLNMMVSLNYMLNYYLRNYVK